MTSSTLKKIKAADLKPGMHLHGRCRSWMDHPFWRSKFTLSDPADIRRILDSGIVEAWIDTTKGDDLPAATRGKPPADSVPFVTTTHTQKADARHARASKQGALDEEIKRAAMICVRARSAVVSMSQEVRMGKAINAEAAGERVEEISSSVLRNPGARISLVVCFRNSAT